jgi:FeS assembly SUF system regulator
MIKLSRMADYGVILMTQLARESGSVTTAAELAASCALPLPTVSKLLKQLSQDGLLESRRGIKGGYALARPAEAISMADIIGAVEGPIALTDCMDSDGALCEIEALCPTRTNWRRINDVLTRALDGVSLAEMVLPSVDFMTLFPVRETAQDLREEAQ